MRKTLITVSTAILLTCGVFDGPINISQTAHAQTVITQGEVVKAVNFRTGPSTSSKAITMLPTGTKFDVLEVVNSNWIKVKIRNTTGYVSSSSKYVREIGQASGSSQAPKKAELADQIIKAGLKYKGTPYKFGARSGQTRTFDCSSFTQYVFGLADVKLPRDSRQQSRVGKTISKSNLQKGDLLFFKTGNRADGKIDHVAIYMGDGKVLHSIPNGGVQVAKVNSYWERTFVGAKRVL